MEMPSARMEIDITQLRRAMELSNEVIDKLRVIKEALAELNEAAGALDLKVTFNGTQAGI